jgi:glucan 1,3-beta-glucosidase
VRLPVGYWIFGGYEPFAPTVSYVDKAFAWAQKHGLAVLLDLHAVPGSQNGKVHSGRIGTVDWPNGNNLEQTMAVLTQLVERYGSHPALLGISLLNEPSPAIPARLLQAFYEQAYASLREHCSPDAWIVFSDGFKPRKWRKRLPAQNYPGLYIDTHQYQIYTWYDKLMSTLLHVWRARILLRRKLARIARSHPLIVGEWSLALPAGRSASAEYAQAQLRAFESSSAWFYWTYKTEYGSAWSYRDCVARGLIA